MLLDYLTFSGPMLMTFCGFGVGLLVGMTGVGAGALTTPLLISGFGIAPTVAVGTDLLFAGLTKAGGAWRHHRLGHVNWGIFTALAIGSISAASLTILAISHLEADQATLGEAIRLVLAGTLVLSAIAVPLIPMLLVRRVKARSSQVRVRPLWTALMGLVLGVIVTLTSVGAGAIGVAILTLLYPMLRARYIVGTDIVHAVPLTLLSGLGHLSIGNIDFSILLALLIGSLPGILIGARLTSMVPDWLLRLTLALVLATSAYLVIAKI